jgi:hypothetical protein
MRITTIAIDLAKNDFQVHGVDRRGQVVLRKQLLPCTDTVLACSLTISVHT